MPEPLRTWLGVSPAAAVAVAADPNTFYGARIAPIFAARCALCHGANKQRGKLRLDDYAFIMRGGKDGAVVKAGDPAGSEIVRRISLPPGADDFMPAEGKPPLAAEQIQLIKLWIAAGASATQAIDAIAGAPVMEREPEKFAPDYTPQEQQIGAIEAALGVRLLPRSQIKTDGLTLRCVSAPQRCDDAAIKKLAAIAPLIVDAELARSAVTDAGLETLSRFENLRYLDLSRTSVTGAGVRKLAALQKLERLNLTADSVSDGDLAALRQSKALKHIYAFAQ
jgi:mono/diheme cytochrome c family protein